MAYSNVDKAAIYKYREKNTRIEISLPYEEKQLIIEHAEKQNETTAAFIKRAIQETIERDNSSD